MLSSGLSEIGQRTNIQWNIRSSSTKTIEEKNIGTRLMIELMKIANEREYATMVAGVDSSNEVSRAMHEKLGFTDCGTIERVGYKFGKWLAVVFYQYELQGPVTPKEE